MGAVAVTVIAGLRRRRRSLAVLAALLGLSAGAVLAAAAAARRTETAYDRFLREGRGGELFVGPYDDSIPGFYDDMVGNAGIRRIARLAGFTLVPTRPSRLAGGVYPAVTSVDGTYFFEVDRPRVLHGRMPDPDAVDEIAVNPTFATAFGVGAGDTIDMVALDVDAAPVAPARPADGELLHMLVAAVVVARTDIVAVGQYDAAPHLYATPALYRHLAPRFGTDFTGALVDLAPGTDPSPALARVAARGAALGTGSVLLDNAHDQAVIDRAIQPQANALWAFAALVGLVSALVFGQLLARQVHLDASDDAALRAVGMSRGQRTVAAGLRGLAVGAGAALVAVATAVAASVAGPIGPARLAERHPGLAVHVPILAAGAGTLTLAGFVIFAGTAALTVRPRRATFRERGSAASRILDAIGTHGSPAAVLGRQFALRPRFQESAVPLRAALGAVAVALAAIAGTIVFAGSLQHLVSTPASYGQDWDVALDAGFNFPATPAVLHEFGEDPDVDAIAGGRYLDLVIDGTEVSTIAVTDLKGTTFPTIVDGRAPRGAGEIVIGRRTLATLGRKVGDVVHADAGNGPHPFRVVGTAVFPQLARGSFTSLGLGVGAALRPEALPPEVLAFPSGVPDEVEAGVTLPSGEFFNFLTFRYAAGAPRAALDRRVERYATGEVDLATSQRPAAVSNAASVRLTFGVLTGVLGVLGAGIIALVLITGIRERRRDLAVCRTLGLDRRGVRALVLWQASTVAALAVALGVPLGVVIGRVGWGAYARNLGVPPAPVVSLLPLAIAAVAAVALANIVALAPAAAAARRAPAEALRAE